jgi:serine/threonine protein kinase/CHASE2 domain-containing sensor protein
MKECARCRCCFDDSLAACAVDGSPVEVTLDGPAVIDGKYRLEKRLGQGGMGVVYRARHISLARIFALKLVSPARVQDPSFVGRFRVEAEALGRLKHAHIVDVTDYGVDPRGGGLPYLVMEYLEGIPLHELRRKAGALPPREAIHLLQSIAAGIDHAHANGVLHRDLKPGNVFLSGPAGAPSPKILDFGLARLLQSGVERAGGEVADSDRPTLTWALAEPGPRPVSPTTPSSRLTEPDSIVGTPAYIAPEVVRGEVPTAASDIYGFGVLAYELVVGRCPFEGTAVEAMGKALLDVAPRPSSANPSVPPELDESLLAPLQKDPARRPRSATEVVDGLRRTLHAADRRTWRAREIPRRLALMALLAPAFVGLTVALRHVAAVEALELKTVDARFELGALGPPDPRLLVVSIDEASLAADPTPLAERVDEFSLSVGRIFDAGARAVAVDLLLPEWWSRSEAFSQLVLRHEGGLTLAAFATPSGDVVGAECLKGLTAAALGPERVRALFGFVNLDEDVDGVVRRARRTFPVRGNASQDSFAFRAARVLEGSASGFDRTDDGDPFLMDQTPDWRGLERFSWKDVPRTLERDPSTFRGRLVLIGSDLAGSGDEHHRIPMRGERSAAVPGVVVQALIVNAFLAGASVREADGRSTVLVQGPAFLALLAAILCVPRRRVALSGAVVIFLLYLVTVVALFEGLRLILPIVAPLTSMALALAVALAIRAWLPPFPAPGLAP